METITVKKSRSGWSVKIGNKSIKLPYEVMRDAMLYATKNAKFGDTKAFDSAMEDFAIRKARELASA